MILKLASQCWLKIRVAWSNFKNRNDIVNYEVTTETITATEVLALSKVYYKNFEYTLDGIEDMLDSMHFPAQCYKDLITEGLKDDCDGYHAAMYHQATSGGINCYLLTYLTTDVVSGHTVLVMYDKTDKYYLLDYTTLLKGDTIQDVLEACVKRRNVEITSYNLVKFDYNKGKYYIC